MLPTFVIGLREGLEAALIVGIIAAFLKQQGRRDLLRWVYGGVVAAVLLCLGVVVALKVVSSNLPQRQQEGLETVVGVLAVGMVTYMVVWMRRHSRQLKAELEGLAAAAIGEGGSRAGRAMVLMAFLAVLREGFETVVFLLAAFDETGDTAGAAGGALAGIAVAVVLGWAIYRGGVRLNLSKFFRATGLVLVLVAAGLVVNALHTAHEAGWLNAGQGGTVDLTWLVSPGSVQSALLTGMLGIQQHPVVIEVAGWLAYLLPVGLYVAWPPSRPVSRRTMLRVWSGLAAAALAAVAALAIAVPGRSAQDPVTAAGPLTVSLSGPHTDTAVARTSPASPAAANSAAANSGAANAGAVGQPAVLLALRRTGGAERAGVAADVYTGTRPGSGAVGRPTVLSFERAAALNGGRLPLGVVPQGVSAADDSVRVQYADADELTVWVEPSTGRVLDLRWTETVRATLVGTQVGAVPLSSPVARGSRAFPAATVAEAAAAAKHDLRIGTDRSDLLTGVWLAAGVAVVALAAAGLTAAAGRRQRAGATSQAALSVSS